MTKGSEPAFPQPNIKIVQGHQTWSCAGPIEYGMSLRTYAAIKAMQGLLAGNDWASKNSLASQSVILADELLAELEKTEGKS